MFHALGNDKAGAFKAPKLSWFPWCVITITPLKSFNIYRNLAWLNELPADRAEELFLSVSGSELWARELARSRPFPLVEQLFQTAESLWFSLPAAERIAAFSCAGEAKTNGTSSNGNSEMAIEDIKGLYRDKFGFIFVLSDEGKSPDEVLAVCKARLGNSVATELQIAADEHRKMIESRLSKLLEK